MDFDFEAVYRDVFNSSSRVMLMRVCEFIDIDTLNRVRESRRLPTSVVGSEVNKRKRRRRALAATGTNQFWQSALPMLLWPMG